MNKIILGSVVALVTFATIVYAIETNKSIIHLIIGFTLFILPIIFITSFNSTGTVFLLVLFTSFIGYGIYKYEYYDILYGLFLAIVNGGAVSYFRVEQYENFSPSDYKKETKKSKDSE